MINIITPRPPLNLFQVVRVEVDDTPTLVLEVPRYEIPPIPPAVTPTYIDIADILTNMIITNLGATAATATITIEDPNAVSFVLAEGISIPGDDYIPVAIDRQVMLTAEKMYVQMGTGQTANVHLSFVQNQRESYTVITP